jgi:hypothetical protein
MSPRRTTVPPTRKHPPSSSSERKGLIARDKTKKQSAKRRTALDNRFHRTFFHSAARGLHAPPTLTYGSLRSTRAFRPGPAHGRASAAVKS